MILFSCPRCSSPVALEHRECPSCTAALAFHPPSRRMVEATGFDIEVDGGLWHECANRREWRCNWLVADQSGARCFACRLVRHRPPADDTLANEKLADALGDQHRLLVQLQSLGIPVDPWFEGDGGLGFDLLSSYSENRVVTIGHANGIVTLDLVETLDQVREQTRVQLGEAYRTMLGHYRHEAGHYYQWILVEQTRWIDECRTLFGDERASYTDALARHYESGAPEGWQDAFISEYATMHPWEDFAETFAHYLHITGVLQTSASAGVVIDAAGPVPPQPVRPRPSYGPDDFDAMLADWRWTSGFFNQVNRSIGKADFYPFRFVAAPVVEKLRFVHRVLTALPPTHIAPTDGFARRAA